MCRSWHELMHRFAGEQIRNMGTVGGNIANGSPIGDTPPAFIALGAKLMLRKGQHGARSSSRTSSSSTAARTASRASSSRALPFR
jgi:xanthine dehydrogenase iron-sulfur cluster and FAD-binding subunit A